MNIIIDLQESANNSQIKVSDLLRKALIVATKLNVESFKNWVDNELNGYETPPTPKYRSLRGEIRAQHPTGVWKNVNFLNEEDEEYWSKRDLLQPISEIESMVGNDEEVKYKLSESILDSRSIRQGAIPYCFVHPSAFFGVLDAVRTIVLEWTLKLDTEGIVGISEVKTKTDQVLLDKDNKDISGIDKPHTKLKKGEALDLLKRLENPNYPKTDSDKQILKHKSFTHWSSVYMKKYYPIKIFDDAYYELSQNKRLSISRFFQFTNPPSKWYEEKFLNIFIYHCNRAGDKYNNKEAFLSPLKKRIEKEDYLILMKK